MDDKREKHFVLVHGACHGAWGWYKLATLLRSDGHRVTVLDMAASGIHPKQEQEVHSMSDYLEPLMEFMATLPKEEKVVMVGHCLGGVALSFAMERFPKNIVVAVFATAFMPSSDLTAETISQELIPALYFVKEEEAVSNPTSPPRARPLSPITAANSNRGAGFRPILELMAAW